MSSPQDSSNGEASRAAEETDGITKWIAEFVFGKSEPTPQPQPENDMPASSVSPPVASHTYTSPFRSNELLPHTTETPPAPPPRRRHQELQQQQQQQRRYMASVSPTAAAATTQPPVTAARYQHRNNRISAASTLVDMDPAEEEGYHKRHYGPAPAHTARRYAKKNIRLTDGNLVIERPLPDRLLSAIPRKAHEFSTMRYTAVTCEPDEFPHKNYTLRQQHYGRSTELFIVMTMYNVSKKAGMSLTSVCSSTTHIGR